MSSAPSVMPRPVLDDWHSFAITYLAGSALVLVAAWIGFRRWGTT